MREPVLVLISLVCQQTVQPDQRFCPERRSVRQLFQGRLTGGTDSFCGWPSNRRLTGNIRKAVPLRPGRLVVFGKFVRPSARRPRGLRSGIARRVRNGQLGNASFVCGAVAGRLRRAELAVQKGE